jgi:predicted esterase YcpF (UPF0227 family)
MIEAGTRDWPSATMAVIGSSLGGYYATWLAQQRSCRAVLLNPAVDPARDLARYIGEQTAWHDPSERFYFEPHFVDELRALHAGPLNEPERLMAVIATGDEVLDWREMRARYAQCRLRVVEGSDHALSDFEDHLPSICDHLALQTWGQRHAASMRDVSLQQHAYITGVRYALGLGFGFESLQQWSGQAHVQGR